MRKPSVLLFVGSCVWLFIATVFKMPVSGTHSIVGATVGFALVAHGAGGVDWKKFGLISKLWTLHFTVIFADLLMLSLINKILSSETFRVTGYGMLYK